MHMHRFSGSSSKKGVDFAGRPALFFDSASTLIAAEVVPCGCRRFGRVMWPTKIATVRDPNPSSICSVYSSRKLGASADITVHEPFVEVAPQEIVDEVLLFPAILCPSGLVLEHNVVIPSPLDSVILTLVQ